MCLSQIRKWKIPIEADWLAELADLQRQVCDEEDGSRLDPEQVAVGVQRELDFVKQRNCGAEVNRSEAPEDQRVWSARWCFWRKPH